jgi:phytoene dehydrogenase-like protein
MNKSQVPVGAKPGEFDAVVVGSGPNGLAAAVTLARAKLSVLVLEANRTIGGAAHSTELTLPGFVHDVGSAVHPMAVGSPFFRRLPLRDYGLEWIHPDIPLSHPLGGADAVSLRRSLSETIEAIGVDGATYKQLMNPLVENWWALADEFLQPMLHLPRNPLALARFGLRAIQPAQWLAGRFSTEPARALFAGLAAHSFLPLTALASAAFGLVLGAAGHVVGWPFPRGGAQKISDALAGYLQSLGGKIETGKRIATLGELPRSRALLLDITPRAFLTLAGGALPQRYRSKLERFRYGPGVFKIDYALSDPIPWRAEECRRAGTVHVGGSISEIAASEDIVARRHAPKPFVLLAQPTVSDSSRAPAGSHIAWAYCHTPNGSVSDLTGPVEDQIERFAPGFRDCVLARHKMNSADLERRNANLVGGAVNGGSLDLWQLLARPILSPQPYRTPLSGVYLCSASTPPGGGVHGMCGYNAAQLALREIFQIRGKIP